MSKRLRAEMRKLDIRDEMLMTSPVAVGAVVVVVGGAGRTLTVAAVDGALVGVVGRAAGITRSGRPPVER
eukprot:gene21455-15930_t